MDKTKEPGIKISQIYLARSLFGHIENAMAMPPNTPVGLIPTDINVQIGVQDAEKVGFCSLTVKSNPESKSLYQFLVEMVLIVEESGEPNMSLEDYVTRAGPPTLYPFIRETIASMSSKGRFGTLWLPPINFVPITENLLKQRAVPRSTETASG